MYLHLANRSKYKNLHLSTALEDWDMIQELKQCVTIDQYFAGAEQKMDRLSVKREQSLGVLSCMSKEETPQVFTHIAVTCLLLQQGNIAENDPPSTPIPPPLCIPRCYGRKVHIRRSLSQYENWPRPPINYCNLISLALRNSSDGSLNVQQIYSFVREHFPFFRAAPDGWKNTVRHNLCFSSSFEKISGWVCADGHRRSCLWKLTCQGRKKFRTEMLALSDELLRILRRSMSKPALMELMFGM
ncbi:PREDICTED: forkhead box protein R1 [Nanorana parkeri]|uniref:forkhead box protein R1 n=1 Tax=Nanorana parkeri TaxID=125878 RepID=UPI000854AC19|nr:PREDICTED: forkhead box protein R1 [Nanorana parkeri]